MLRFSILLSSFFVLVACQTTVNSPGPATPEMDQIIQTVVAEANADNGERLGSDLIARGATSEGNTITFNYEVSQSLSETFRDLPRGQVDAYLRTTFRQDLCSGQGPRAFIQTGGRIEMRFNDALGRSVSGFTVSNC